MPIIVPAYALSLTYSALVKKGESIKGEQRDG